jgi:hypothetical protein
MMMVHGFGKMEHLGKFNLRKDNGQNEMEYRKIKCWMTCGPNKMGNSKTYESNQDNG